MTSPEYEDRVLLLKGVRHVSTDVRWLQFSINREESAYYVSIHRDPFLRLEAPHSLLLLLGRVPDGLRRLLEVIRKDVAGEKPVLPHRIGCLDEIKGAESFTHNVTWPRNLPGCHAAKKEIAWSICHLAREVGNTLFPTPFEHRVIADEVETFSRLAEDVDAALHSPRDARTIQAPKANAGTREATQLDPLDAILYTSLVIQCGEKIESRRVSREDGIVHSFRFSPDDNWRLWSHEIGYSTWEKEIDARAPQAQFIVTADIRDFYHSVDRTFLARQLEGIGIHPRIVAAIIRVLGGVDGRGLPVGPSVSALLAEVVLAHIDERLLGTGIQYVRFNDDFRFFCSSKTSCDEALAALKRELKAAGGLCLQNAKTKIQTSSDFLEEREHARHYWIEKIGCPLDPFKGYEDDITIEQSRDIAKAKHFLLEALNLGEGEDATKSARAAFRAIPPGMRAEFVPRVVESIFAMWKLSSDIAFSLRTRKVTAELDRDDVMGRFVEAAHAKNAALHDYCLLWMLDAFSKADWPTSNLEPLHRKLPAQSAAHREFLMLMKSPDTLDDGVPRSGWIMRGLARATGHIDTPPLGGDAVNAFERALLEQSCD